MQKVYADAFKETFEAAGGKIVAEEAYVAKDTDFRSTLTRINQQTQNSFSFLDIMKKLV